MNQNRLSKDDPVSVEALKAFADLQDAYMRIAQENLALDRKKVTLVHAANKIEEQRKRMFESILIERGLPLDLDIEVDDTTGAIHIPGEAKPDLDPIPPPSEL